MITIENIRDLNAYLGARFTGESTVRVHIVTDERPGDTVAVEVTPDDNAYVVFFRVGLQPRGVAALISHVYGADVCGGLLMSDAPNSFDELAFNSYMVDIFGSLYHLAAVTD